MTEKQFLEWIESAFIADYEWELDDKFLNEVYKKMKLVVAEAIAEHEQGKWNYKKPRSNDKRMWGKSVLVERNSYHGYSYFSIDTMPLLGKIIRWQELPAPYEPKPDKP